MEIPILFIVTISQQTFAYAMAAQLSCHVQNSVVIAFAAAGWQQMKFPSNFNCDKKTKWHGPQDNLSVQGDTNEAQRGQHLCNSDTQDYLQLLDNPALSLKHDMDI